MSWRFETRTPRGRAARWWIGAAGLVAAAAAAAYWLDPEQGDRRRVRTAERVTALAQALWASIDRRARRLSIAAASRARAPFKGRRAGAETESWPEEAPPDVDSEAAAPAPAAARR